MYKGTNASSRSAGSAWSVLCRAGLFWLLFLSSVGGSWKYDLQPRQRRRSVSYVGGADALRRLVTKLNKKEPIAVAVLGGSISRGHGAGGASGDRELGHPGSWSRVAFDAIKDRWPAEHVYSNGAVPGALRAGLASATHTGASHVFS
jgi:hypothetical protein